MVTIRVFIRPFLLGTCASSAACSSSGAVSSSSVCGTCGAHFSDPLLAICLGLGAALLRPGSQATAAALAP